LLFEAIIMKGIVQQEAPFLDKVLLLGQDAHAIRVQSATQSHRKVLGSPDRQVFCKLLKNSEAMS
jgi:hypothetical protein